MCTAANICEGDSRIVDWSVNTESEKYLDNWQDKLDLMCEESWKVGMLGSSFFIGWASTLLWLPSFGDKYGRKMPFAIAMVLNLFLYGVLMITKNIDVMLANLFVQGALTSVRINIGFLYLQEMMPKHV